MNWVIVEGSSGPVLVDTGYPADAELVRGSLEQVGFNPDELAAILITHGHSDHIGNAADLAADSGAAVFAGPEEVANVRRDVLEQVGIRDLLPHVFRPGVLRWAAHAVRAGGTKTKPVPNVRPLPQTAADIAAATGISVMDVELPGHTRGHTGYYLPDHKALIVGDALVSAHPTSTIAGPQLLPTVFHGSVPAAIAALDDVADIPAQIILPGHGPLLEVTAYAAARLARENGSAF